MVNFLPLNQYCGKLSWKFIKLKIVINGQKGTKILFNTNEYIFINELFLQQKKKKITKVNKTR